MRHDDTQIFGFYSPPKRPLSVKRNPLSPLNTNSHHLPFRAVKSPPMKAQKRLLFTLALAALSECAQAGWTEVEKFEDNTRVFVDQSTATKSDDTAQVLHLVRWGEPQTDPGVPPYLSTVVRTSYHCTEKREKYLASTSYTGPMGNGVKVLADENEAESWYSISDASMEENLWKIACGVK